MRQNPLQHNPKRRESPPTDNAAAPTRHSQILKAHARETRKEYSELKVKITTVGLFYKEPRARGSRPTYT